MEGSPREKRDKKWETFGGDRHKNKGLHSGSSHLPQASLGCSPPVLMGALWEGLGFGFQRPGGMQGGSGFQQSALPSFRGQGGA